MVEIYSLDCTVLIGRFDHFKNAKTSLEELRQSGYFESRKQAVFVQKYKDGIPGDAYIAVFRDGWRTLNSNLKKPKKSSCKPNMKHYYDYSKLQLMHVDLPRQPQKALQVRL